MPHHSTPPSQIRIMSSKEKRRLRRTALSEASDALIRELGATRQSDAELVEELKARIPGREPQEYQEAISRSVFFYR
jgi:hypothetical protein